MSHATFFDLHHYGEDIAVVKTTRAFPDVYILIYDKESDRYYCDVAEVHFSSHGKASTVTFSYNITREWDSPLYARCPTSILKDLTPLDEAYIRGSKEYYAAKEWRRLCAEYNAHQEIKHDWVEETVLAVSNGPIFPGTSARSFLMKPYCQDVCFLSDGTVRSFREIDEMRKMRFYHCEWADDKNVPNAVKATSLLNLFRKEITNDENLSEEMVISLLLDRFPQLGHKIHLEYDAFIRTRNPLRKNVFASQPIKRYFSLSICNSDMEIKRLWTPENPEGDILFLDSCAYDPKTAKAENDEIVENVTSPA